MSYEALYRRYRPSRFGNVVGQQHITSTLKNQVIAGRVSHAYLFCGTRGTGKTTTARIFARAINCQNPVDGEPCGACEGCLASGAGIDIIEIDGGSSSRVDEVRDLLEKVRFAPVSCKYKVYIIDEVHTLSREAFTALLKTLEEPPAHVVFLLATTEPGKLPATIHSRCQRFDFHRVSTPDLVKLLASIMRDIGATFDQEGLRAIALAGQGSVRDTLSIADECLAFCENDLTGLKVRAVLGSVSKQGMFDFVDSLLAGDAKATLGFLDRVVVEGTDLLVFVRDLAGHFRDLMVAISCGASPELIDGAAEDLLSYAKQAQSCPLEKALRAIDLLTSVEHTMKWLTRPRIAVEAALIRICRPQDETPLPEVLLERLNFVERQLENLLQNPRSTPAPVAQSKQPVASGQDLPPFSLDEGIVAQPKNTPAPPPVPAAKAPGPRTETPASPPPSLSSKNSMGAEETFNALLAAMPGMLQPVLARWDYRVNNGKLELLVPKEMQGKLGRLATMFESAMDNIRREQPHLDAVMVNGDSAVAAPASPALAASSSQPEQKKLGLKELGEQIFGTLS